MITYHDDDNDNDNDVLASDGEEETGAPHVLARPQGRHLDVHHSLSTLSMSCMFYKPL